MKRSFVYILSAILALVLSCQKNPSGFEPAPELPSYAAGEKAGNISYQLLIYSFADSDGDGIGDFRGIIQHLDYLDAMGVSAIWLSPAHPCDNSRDSGYHGYGVTDYYALNPDYGTEEDFKALLSACHAKGINVYMDYVLNHSGKGHPWFKDALTSASSPYRDYYLICSNPSSEYRNFPMLANYSYGTGDWHSTTSGSPQFKISSTTEAVTSGNASWNLYMWQDGVGDKTVKFKSNGEDSYYAVVEINGKWGILVRKYLNWDAGSKFGAPTEQYSLSDGSTVDLVADGGDMYFTGSGRYRIEISNLTTQTVSFMGAFGSWMPDINYGAASSAETSAAFQDLAASADKWISMGVDGLRLDAVKHIYGGMNSFHNPSNVTFLKKWYDRCNTTYKKKNSTDFYMVAEAWMDAADVASYYAALPACFEFSFWDRLEWVLNQRIGRYFCKDLVEYRTKYAAVRPGFIAATKLTNHDQTRAATYLNKDQAKLKQAAAFLMSAEGEPYIYQGEEVGYWGKDSDDGGDDEAVRVPLVWGGDASVPVKLLRGKYDSGMLASTNLFVPNQQRDKGSLLWVYMDWAKARNTCPALHGKMSAHGTYNKDNSQFESVACWYMTATNGEKALVVHNVGSSQVVLDFPSDNLSTTVVTLGSVSVSGKVLTLGANSSAVFQL